MVIDGIDILGRQPGELRLGITKLKGNQPLAREFEAHFGAIRGVTRITVDHHRGEVQVQYNPEELGSLSSLLVLRDTVARFFPEVNPLALAGWFSKIF